MLVSANSFCQDLLNVVTLKIISKRTYVICYLKCFRKSIEDARPQITVWNVSCHQPPFPPHPQTPPSELSLKVPLTPVSKSHHGILTYFTDSNFDFMTAQCVCSFYFLEVSCTDNFWFNQQIVTPKLFTLRSFIWTGLVIRISSPSILTFEEAPNLTYNTIRFICLKPTGAMSVNSRK